MTEARMVYAEVELEVFGAPRRVRIEFDRVELIVSVAGFLATEKPACRAGFVVGAEEVER